MRGVKLLLFVSLLAPVFVYASSSVSVPVPDSTRPIKTVALTFDDGPYGTSTQEVLSILKREHVHATFFLIGKNVSDFPEETKQIVAEGHVIGNHTYMHTKLSNLTTEQALSDVAKGEKEIASTTGIQTHLFRPPYGILPTALKKRLKRQGYKIKMWNDDPSDWNYASSTSELIVSRTLVQQKDHMVLLLHDGRDTKINYPRDNMLTALPILIEDLEKQGYTFVTL